MARFVEDLLDLYAEGKLTDKELLTEVERRRSVDEYYRDLDQLHLRKRIEQYQDIVIPYGKSPEDIVIEREREQKIVHFFHWVKNVIPEDDWKLWSVYILKRRLTMAALGRMFGIEERKVGRKIKSVTRKIRNLMPFYTEQFGDLELYLKE